MAPKSAALLAEFLGTFMLVNTIVLGVGPTHVMHSSAWHPFAIGTTLMIMIYALGHVSGAHFNPAVTLGAALNGAFKGELLTPVLYMLVQVAGGIAAGFTAFAISGITLSPPPPTSSTLTIILSEVIYTMLLVLTVLNVAMVPSKQPNAYYGLAIGFAVLGGALCVGGLSGGVFNPAVGTGLMLAAHTVGDASSGAGKVGLYWLAPFIGAVLAVGVCKLMNRDAARERPSKSVNDETGPLLAERLAARQSAGDHHHATAADVEPGYPAVVVTELVGTFILTLSAVLSTSPIGVGAILMVIVYMGDHISGAQYNPAVTLGIALRSRTPMAKWMKEVGAKVAAQLVGAFAAAAAWQLLINVDAHGGPHMLPSFLAPDGKHGASGALVFEGIYTTILVLVVLSMATPTSADNDTSNFYGLAIGFTVGSAALCSGATGGGSGGVFNPAVGVGLGFMDTFGNGMGGAHLPALIVVQLVAAVVAVGLFKALHPTAAKEAADLRVSSSEMARGKSASYV